MKSEGFVNGRLRIGSRTDRVPPVFPFKIPFQNRPRGNWHVERPERTKCTDLSGYGTNLERRDADSQSNQRVVLWRLLRLALAGVSGNTCFPYTTDRSRVGRRNRDIASTKNPAGLGICAETSADRFSDGAPHGLPLKNIHFVRSGRTAGDGDDRQGNGACHREVVGLFYQCLPDRMI